MSDMYIILFVYNVVDTLMEIVLFILFMCNSSIKTSRLTSPKLSLANRKVMRVVYYRPVIILSNSVDCQMLGKMSNRAKHLYHTVSGMFSIQGFRT